MISVCVSGARGRMGQMLVGLVEVAGDLRLAAALERVDHPDLGAELGAGVRLSAEVDACVAAADVLLDFSLPETVCAHVEAAARLGKPAVSGTTGFSPEQLQTLASAARSVPLVVASNMSRGVFVLNRLVEQAAILLGGYDAEIFEIHHRNKVDAPSGTAHQLAGTIEAATGAQSVYAREAKRLNREIGISAARGGDVVGEHQVLFLGEGEQLILTHRATSREHFCRGALAAVRFAHGRAPGRYDMTDVFRGG